MSYILDALKKSEMQARQGELPTIHSTHLPGDARPGRPGWHFALFGGVAVGVVFAALILLRPADQPVQAPAVAPTASIRPEPPLAANPQEPAPREAHTPAAPSPPPDMSLATNIPTPQPETMVATEPVAKEQIMPVANTPDDAATIPMPDIQPRPTSMQSAPMQSAPMQPTAPLLGSLPVDVQQSIPAIDISGHIFDAQPARRMVFVNGHIRREGEDVASGLKLEAITADGVQLNYRGTSFRIDLFGKH